MFGTFNATVFTLVWCMTDVPLTDVPLTDVPITDVKYAQACGPISAYVALEALNVPVKLDDVAEKCGWKLNEKVTVGSIFSALASYTELRVSSARLTPEELHEKIGSGGCAAILPVRKNSSELNHALCFVQVDGANLIAVDYPELKLTFSSSQLADCWDGEAIIVQRVDRLLTTEQLLYVLLGIFIAVPIVLMLKRRSSHSVLFLLMFFGQSSFGDDLKSVKEAIATHDVKLPCTPLTVDLGVVAKGESQRVVFNLTSKSKESIKLVGASASCACVTIRKYPNEISVDAPGQFELAVDPRQSRKISSTVRLLSEQGVVFVATISAQPETIWLEPPVLDIGRHSGKGKASISFSVFYAGTPKKLESVSADRDEIVLELKNPPPDLRNSARGVNVLKSVNVEWDVSKLGLGPHTAKITVKTRHKPSELLHIPVSIYLVGDVRAVPPIIVFGNISGDKKSLQRQLKLNFNSPVANLMAKDLQVESQAVGVTFEVFEVKGSELTLSMEVDCEELLKSMPPGLLKGDVIGRTGEDVVFSVPYIALIRK